MDTVKTVGGILIVILLVRFFAGAFGNEIVSYPAKIQPDGTLNPLNKTTYRVNSSTQTIIYWMDLGTIMDTPDKLVDCVIRDKENWIGYYPDRSGWVQMYKGKRFPTLTDDPNIIYIGHCHWWVLSYLGNSSWLFLKKIIILGSIIIGIGFLYITYYGIFGSDKYAKKHETEGVPEKKKPEGD